MTWTSILALALGTYALKAAGPVLLRGRELPRPAGVAVGLLPAALLAALVATQTVVVGQTLVIDARLAGLAVAGVAVWRRAPLLFVVLAASATTALVRALSG